MQADLETRSSSPTPSLFVHEDEEKEFAEIAAKISEDFDFKLSFLKLTSEQSEDSEEVEEVEEEQNEAEVADEDDFTFAISGSDSTAISGEGTSTDAQIRPYFPLFNQDLLLAHEDYKKPESKLPSRPPVEKVFIESPPSEGETNDVNRTYCEWEKPTPELSKKSNSTGFSKLWRFKEYLHRSHSDGRDAFVFLNNEAKREVKSVQKKITGEASSEKKPEVKVSAEKKAVKKGKKTAPPLSAHEVYLRSKGIYPDYDRRRSHLPFQPVGFFTNVSGGGLSKNVHPY